MPLQARNPACYVQNLYISDKVFSEAFHRYAQVSRAARRHGSNVPGPLEAARRLSKRRMGMASAVTASSSVPSIPFDLGALLGLKRWAAPSFERGMKYEPPMTNIPRDISDNTFTISPPLVATAHNSLGQGVRSEPEAPAPVVSSRIDDPDLISLANQPTESVEESQSLFNTILAAHDGITSLRELDLNPFLDFLQGPKNVPAAMNAMTLFRWLEIRSGASESSSQPTGMLQGLAAMSAVSWYDLSKVFIPLLRTSDSIVPIAELMNCAMDVTATAISWRQVRFKVTEDIVNLPDREVTRGLLDLWMSAVQEMKTGKHGTWEDRHGIYEIISKSGFKPSQLPIHFASLPEPTLVRILLKHWVVHHRFDPPLAKAEPQPGEDDHPTATLNEPMDRPGYKVFKPSALDADTPLTFPPYSEISVKYEKFRWGRDSDKDIPQWMKGHLINLAHVVAKYNLPYSGLLHEIFLLYRQRVPPHIVEVRFWDAHHRPHLNIPRRLAMDMLDWAMERRSYMFAFRVFKHTASIPLIEALELPIRLIQSRKMSVEKIFVMFNRRTVEDTVPMEDRINPKRALKQEIVDMMEKSAYLLSKSPYTKAHIGFRRAWEVFRFLHARNQVRYHAHDNPSTLLSRAFVNAGIARCFEERRPMSKAMTDYIVSMVARIEGYAQARVLRKLISELYAQFVNEGALKNAFKRRNKGENSSFERERLAAHRIDQFLKPDARSAAWHTADGPPREITTLDVPSEAKANIFESFSSSAQRGSALDDDSGLSEDILTIEQLLSTHENTEALSTDPNEPVLDTPFSMESNASPQDHEKSETASRRSDNTLDQILVNLREKFEVDDALIEPPNAKKSTDDKGIERNSESQAPAELWNMSIRSDRRRERSTTNAEQLALWQIPDESSSMADRTDEDQERVAAAEQQSASLQAATGLPNVSDDYTKEDKKILANTERTLSADDVSNIHQSSSSNDEQQSPHGGGANFIPMPELFGLKTGTSDVNKPDGNTRPVRAASARRLLNIMQR